MVGLISIGKEISGAAFLRSMTRNIQDTETISVSVQRCTDKKTRKVHSMEYYSAIKRKSCQFYATETDLEGIMLSEIS